MGFGDAGAEIIADNIRSTQELDPMIPGKRVHAIFAFCDVRHFTAVTEVLYLWGGCMSRVCAGGQDGSLQNVYTRQA